MAACASEKIPFVLGHALYMKDSWPRGLEKQHGKAKAISILAARIARTAWLMLKRKEAFDVTRFLK